MSIASRYSRHSLIEKFVARFLTSLTNRHSVKNQRTIFEFCVKVLLSTDERPKVVREKKRDLDMTDEKQVSENLILKEKDVLQTSFRFATMIASSTR